MKMPDHSEQWLLDGLCNECRRQDYCTKPCKRNKVRIEREVNAYISEKMGLGRIFDAFGVREEVREWAYTTIREEMR